MRRCVIASLGRERDRSALRVGAIDNGMTASMRGSNPQTLRRRAAWPWPGGYASDRPASPCNLSRGSPVATNWRWWQSPWACRCRSRWTSGYSPSKRLTATVN